MVAWDPQQYLKFAADRGRPFVDLVARIGTEPSSVLDLGCGPGQLTSTMRERWPEAFVLGVDSSPEMVEAARVQNADPLADYEQADVETWTPGRTFDLVVSNAMFQWVTDQFRVIEHLLPAAPTWAIQVPDNGDSPAHRLLSELSEETPWRGQFGEVRPINQWGPLNYLEFFGSHGWNVDAWSTTYLHVLSGDDAVFEWMKGTGARAYLSKLPPALAESFAAEYRDRLRLAFPQRPWGTVLPFRRTFVVATRL